MKDTIIKNNQLFAVSKKGEEVVNFINLLPSEISENKRGINITQFNRSNNYRIYLVNYFGLNITVLEHIFIDKFIFLHGDRYNQIVNNIERLHHKKNLKKWKASYKFINFYDKYKKFN